MSLRAADRRRRRAWPSRCGRGGDAARSVYSGARSDLRGQVDEIAAASAPARLPRPARGAGRAPGADPAARRRPATARRCGRGRTAARPARRISAPGPPARFGGAAGLRPVRLPDGRDGTPAGRAARDLPVERPSARDRAAARSGRLLPPHASTGRTCAVLTLGDRRTRRRQIALPLTQVDHDAAAGLLLTSRSWSASACCSRRCSGRSSRARRSRRSRASPRRTEHADRRLDLSQRLRWPGGDELRAPGGELQRDARRARAVGRGAAPPGRRRLPRAAHADRGAAREHPDLPRRRAGCPSRSARPAQRHHRGARRAHRAGRATCVELARGAAPTARASDVRLDEIVRDAVERAQRRAPATALRASSSSRRSCAARATGSAARSRTCSTTRASGARPAGWSRSRCATGC